MRLFATLLLLCTLSAVHAQFSPAVNGGYNTNSLKPGGQGVGGNNGWQASLQVEYSLKHWFVYSGAGISENSFFLTRYNVGDFDKITYHPVYINVPLGVGYSIGIAKNIAIRLYAGVYGSLALGGNLTNEQHTCGDLGPCPENPPVTSETKRAIKFGNNADVNGTNDLTQTNAGLQFGTGIKIFRKFELVGMYNAGFTNIIPMNDYNFHTKLNSVTVDLKYNIYGK